MEWFLSLSQKFKDGIFLLWTGPRPVICIYKPEMIKVSKNIYISLLFLYLNRVILSYIWTYRIDYISSSVLRQSASKFYESTVSNNIHARWKVKKDIFQPIALKTCKKEFRNRTSDMTSGDCNIVPKKQLLYRKWICKTFLLTSKITTTRKYFFQNS